MDTQARPQENPVDDEISLLDLFLVLVKHKWLVFGLPVLAAAIAAVVVFLLPNKFTATLKIAPSKSSALYLWMLKSDSLSFDIAQKLDLQKIYGTSGRGQLLRGIDSHVKVTSNPKDGYVDVMVTDKDPALAARVANAFGEGMVDNLLKLRLTDMTRAIYELKSRRELIQKDIEAAQRELGKPELAKVVAAISTADRYGISSMAGIQAEQSMQSMQSIQSIQSVPLGAELTQSEMVRLQEQVATLQRMLVDASKRQVPAVEHGLLMAAVDQYQKHAYAVALIDRLDRRIAFLAKQEREEIKLLPAEVPDEKSGPKRTLIILLAGLAGFFVAVLTAFVREWWGNLNSDANSSVVLGKIRSHWGAK